jgi:hypothetical protein
MHRKNLYLPTTSEVYHDLHHTGPEMKSWINDKANFALMYA